MSDAAWITQIERDVRQAETELAEARAQRDYLKDAFLTDPLTFATDPDGDCWFCGGPTDDFAVHDEDGSECPVTKARAALAQPAGHAFQPDPQNPNRCVAPITHEASEGQWVPCYEYADHSIHALSEPLRAARPKSTCGTEPPFDPDGCGHDHHGWLVCGELIGSSGGPMPEPDYCEHIDRRYAIWLEQQARAALAGEEGAG